jgi:hypothetical protein
MTQIRTDITDDAGVAGLPAGKRSQTYYLGRGLHAVVTPSGKRKFIVYVQATAPVGWPRSKKRLIGYWPTVSLKKARELAGAYRIEAAKTCRMPPPPAETLTACEPILLQDTLHPPWTPEDALNED